MIRPKGDLQQAEALIEELLIEVVELRTKLAEQARPTATVTDINARRKK